MIYDRTAEDVEKAKEYRAKLQNGPELTEVEIAVMERGTITINTLNRIENKQAELQSLFISAGYYSPLITNKEWTYNGIFDATEYQRLIDNVNTLKNAFYIYSDTPNTPPVSYHYEDINSLEKILFDLDSMIADMKSRYRQCGTFQCGEVNEN